MTEVLTRAEIYEHLARLEREGHPRPWEEFTIRFPVGVEEAPACLQALLGTPYPVRLKPQLPPMVKRTIKYPEPVREVPEYRQRYYLINPAKERYYQRFRWHGGEYDLMWLHRGLIHLTERNARAHGTALAGCSQDEIDAVLRGDDDEG